MTAASARFLLGMKLLAARVERDTDDIVTLARLLGLTTASEVLAAVTDMYPASLIPVRYLVEELFPPVR